MKALKITFASYVLYTGLVLLGALGTISYAEAAETPNSCATPVIQDFTPYVYEDGDLHSFDYMVQSGDIAPTVVATVVNDMPLETRYNSIWEEGVAGKRKIHVDVPSWNGFPEEVPIAVSVTTGAGAGCVSHQQFLVKLPPKQQKKAVDTPAIVPTTPLSEKEEESALKWQYEKIKQFKFGIVGPIVKTFDMDEVERDVKKRMRDVKEKKFGIHMEGQLKDIWSKKYDAEHTFLKTGGEVSFEHSKLFGYIKKMTASDDEKECKSWPTAAWVLLTIISIAVVLIIIDSLPYLLAGGGARFGLALLAMFLAMIGMWFVFDQCRDHRWFPIAVTLITLFTLIAPTNLEKKRRGKKV
jgi:hypothetical protein